MADRPEHMAVGVEEEFHTVDLATHRLLPRADSLLRQLPPDRFGAELQRSVVETNSRPFVRLIDLAEDLAALRRRVVAAAQPLGLGIVAAGTVPVAELDALTITPDPRYENMLEEYQLLAREQLICGAQVHVDVGDRDLAVEVAHRVAPWLPVLLAISASSPFWQGTDTGYASYRTLLWSRWPTTGPVGRFESAQDYDRLLAALVRSGVISDRGMIYFDVRPSAHLPTIELRICDACPRVEDVVLLAGLFRALVILELDAAAGGLPPLPVRTELVRAATWRAARSGLAGELVDPADGLPAPAPVFVRRLLGALRPTLELNGDWELVSELAEAVLADGGSAARQRAAYARGGTHEVVELLLAETRANTEWVPGAGPARREVTAMLAGYDAAADEAVVFDGSARGPYGLVMDALDRIGGAGLRERERRRDEVQRGLGMTGAAGTLPFDLVPRVITADDWRPVQAGLAQRVRALEAFLHDVYGEREILQDDVLPAWTMTESPGLREAGRRVPGTVVRCAVAAIDLARDAAGRWAVRRDALRTPAGFGYAVANRWVAARVLPELIRASLAPAPARALSVLRNALQHTCDALAVVSAGERDPAFFEHRLLARELGAPLVTPDRLRASGAGVCLADGTPVAMLYCLVGEDDLLAAVGPGLLDALDGGLVRLANAPGNGVAEDPALLPYVPRLIQYYLGERPLLESVPTYPCRDADCCEQVLDSLPELVVRSRAGAVLCAPGAPAAALAAARATILADPAGWVAQEPVRLSTHPTFVAGRLRPRAVDLRAFVCQGAGPVVAPVALTRAASADGTLAEPYQNGLTKDTWLMQ